MKRILATLAVIVALALPGSALASTQNGSTSESFTIDATLAATFPATTTYTGSSGTITSGPINVTGVSTNSATYNIAMTTSAFSGPATIPTTARSRSIVTRTGGSCGTPGAARTVGFYSTSSTSDTLINGIGCTSADFPVALSWTMSVVVGSNPAIGTYTGTLSYTITAP